MLTQLTWAAGRSQRWPALLCWLKVVLVLRLNSGVRGKDKNITIITVRQGKITVPVRTK